MWYAFILIQVFGQTLTNTLLGVAWNRSKDALFPCVQKPIEAEERDNVEEYFDKLEYLKARRNNDTNAILKTTVGRIFCRYPRSNRYEQI